MAKRLHQAPDWPRLMPAHLAAFYCGEVSVDAFRRSVGKLWPKPRRVPGKGERWLRDDLDRTIDRLGEIDVQSAADVL